MGKNNISFYDTNIEIDVEKQFIGVDMQLSYHVLEEKTNEISFLLHENLNITNLEGKKIQTYKFNNEIETMLPEAGTLVVYLKEDAYKGEMINIQLSYSGNLGVFKPSGENRITKEWVALGLYFPWFPLNLNQLTTPSITYDINVKIDANYSVFGIGKAEKKNGLWNISDYTPNIDMIVMAAKELSQKQIHGKDMNLEVYYNKDNDLIEKYGLSILNTFIKWFGENEKVNIKIVFTPGGGYGRKGFVVLREPNDKEDLISYVSFLAHELSHLWWTNAPSNTWEEWLNESFAEYSALMIVREKFSKEDFEKMLENKKERCFDTPPIKGLNMKYEKRKNVTYDKGCIVLNNLENKIGKSEFINIMRESYDKKIVSTKEFIQMLNSKVGIEKAKEIDEMLSNY